MNEAKARRIVKEEITVNNKIIFAKIDDKFLDFKTDIKNEFERTAGILAEELKSQVMLIAEYTHSIGESIKRLEVIVDNHEQRLLKAGL